MINQLVELAILMNLSVSATVALPAAVANASQKVGMSEERFVSECFRIAELRDYVAAACRLATA